jgi:hypothetical protein
LYKSIVNGASRPRWGRPRASRYPNHPARQHPGQQAIEDVLLSLIRLGSAIRHVSKSITESRVLGTLVRAHPLLQLLLQAGHVFPQRRAAERIEKASDRQQRVPFAPGDRDVAVTSLDQARRRLAIDEQGLDLEAGGAQLLEISPHGSGANPNDRSKLRDRSPTPETTQCVKYQ